MRSISHIIFLTLLVLFTSGCTRTYWVNRGNDFLDIATGTVGYGAGAIAHVGPVNTGLGFYQDTHGMRGGTVGQQEAIAPTAQLVLWGIDAINFRNSRGQGQIENPRNKNYWIPNYIVPTSWVASPMPGSGKDHIPAPYWTNIEVSGSLGVGFRVGFNPGEFLDFLIGFTTLDIYGDDIAIAPFEKETGSMATMDVGRSFFHRGNFERAIQVFSEILQDNNSDTNTQIEALYLTGHSYLQTASRDQKMYEISKDEKILDRIHFAKTEAYKFLTKVSWDYPDSKWAGRLKGFWVPTDEVMKLLSEKIEK